MITEYLGSIFECHINYIRLKTVQAMLLYRDNQCNILFNPSRTKGSIDTYYRHQLGLQNKLFNVTNRRLMSCLIIAFLFYGKYFSRNQITIKTYQNDHNNILNATKSFIFYYFIIIRVRVVILLEYINNTLI